MASETRVREAPAPDPLHCGLDDASHPPVPDEPVLDVENVQGNILGGFSKDQQLLLYLKIGDPTGFRTWLKQITPHIASSAEVLAFNRLFKAMRVRRGVDPNGLKSTWINIAFSYAGLKKLALSNPKLLQPDFTDAAFREGLAARSARLGDETAPGKPGNKDTWLMGGNQDNEADVIVIVASDDPHDLDATVLDIIKNLKGAPMLKHSHDRGATLQGALRGHEQFGFLDGISQPGVRGRISSDKNDVVTPRQNPNDRNQGKPGQDLLWPGEFVFGYSAQNPNGKDVADPGPVSTAGPAWTKNGSFLVFRRLLQDVFGFHKFLHDQAAATQVGNPNQVGAKLVGRWKSGAPLLRAPNRDVLAFEQDDCANNNFEFQQATNPIPAPATPFDCVDNRLPASPGDPSGARCPFASHIRKAYPRDDTSKTVPDLRETTTQTHRLLRRGIPFGPASTSTPDRPHDDGVTDRGLLFLAYQTSIERQFEFVTVNWVNNVDFKELGAGHDLVIGQNNSAGQNRRRTFKFIDAQGKEHVLEISTDWVIPTGGGYFFAPSIEELPKM